MGGVQVYLLAVAALVRLCAAQASGWDLQDGQVNTTMCYWTTPRGRLTPILPRKPYTDGKIAAVIRDTVYLDGGYLWWQPGMSDGSLGTLIADGKDNRVVERRILII
jgi:hypothetical protein